MTKTTHAPDVTDNFTSRFIRLTAKQLVAKNLAPEADLEDLISDLTVTLVEAVSSFDPHRARWTTYVKAVIERRAVSLVRHRDAERRSGGGATLSLNALVQDGEGARVELGSLITEEAYVSAYGYEHESDTAITDRELDVDAVIATLPEELRPLCYRLKRESLADIARDMGVSATTLSYQVQKIRQHFERAGFNPA